VGLTLPAKMGWPLESVATAVSVTGALAKVGLVVGRPPKRRVWSIWFCWVTRTAKLLPMVESGVSGRSQEGVVRVLVIQVFSFGARVRVDCVPGARRVEERTVLPSSERRRRVW